MVPIKSLASLTGCVYRLALLSLKVVSESFLVALLEGMSKRTIIFVKCTQIYQFPPHYVKIFLAKTLRNFQGVTEKQQWQRS